MTVPLNSARQLAEIMERVDDSLNSFENLELNKPEIFDGVRRMPAELDSTYQQLAESGRARIDVMYATQRLKPCTNIACMSLILCSSPRVDRPFFQCQSPSS